MNQLILLLALVAAVSAYFPLYYNQNPGFGGYGFNQGFNNDFFALQNARQQQMMDQDDFNFDNAGMMQQMLYRQQMMNTQFPYAYQQMGVMSPYKARAARKQGASASPQGQALPPSSQMEQGSGRQTMSFQSQPIEIKQQ